jgi:2-phosphoglycerate kinase
MMYLIGGAPRTGKTILAQQLCTTLKVGWISTDLVMELLRVANAPGRKMTWDAAPEAITVAAEWFFPYLERFIWGVSSFTDHYVIEGVDFLPAQVAQLSTQYAVRAVFLGCSRMTLEGFTNFPGRSKGYANLPEAQRRQIVEDVPRWSAFIRQEAERFGYPFVDMVGDFSQHLRDAERVLTMG